jgi:hypothetical protein
VVVSIGQAIGPLAGQAIGQAIGPPNRSAGPARNSRRVAQNQALLHNVNRDWRLRLSRKENVP